MTDLPELVEEWSEQQKLQASANFIAYMKRYREKASKLKPTSDSIDGDGDDLAMGGGG